VAVNIPFFLIFAILLVAAFLLMLSRHGCDFNRGLEGISEFRRHVIVRGIEYKRLNTGRSNHHFSSNPHPLVRPYFFAGRFLLSFSIQKSPATMILGIRS